MSFVIVKGNLRKVLKDLNKTTSMMVDDALNESGAFIRKEAKQIAPVVTGAYRNSIVKSRVKKMRGGKKIIVGTLRVQPVLQYAARVEKKHKIFRQMEKGKNKDVRNIFIRNMNNALKRNRIST